jgi:hypothetical protein
MKMKIFSIPINPKLTEPQFNDFLGFLHTYKDYIRDLYFTCRMPPFQQDAMGDIFNGSPDHLAILDNAINISKETGIPLSATFNNTLIRPEQSNLDLFIQNFKQIYDTGCIKSATIPHTHWVATKQIQHAFPDLEIKNTILRNVTEPREVVALGEVGFNYVNLDRDLMRDQDKLKEMKRAKEYAGVQLSLLANEGCIGNCPMMDEHYEFNNSRTGEVQYFNDPISRVSCEKWDQEDLAVPLKSANFPPWREDWDELLEYVDVIKMHGRESPARLNETMHIVKNYAENKEILFDTFNDFIDVTNLVDAPINVWRKKIKTCKFECWDCGYCDKVMKAKSELVISNKIRQVTKELVDSVNKDIIIDIEGLSSQRVGNLLNSLGSVSTNYLEIGSYLGFSTCSVLKDNDINVFCVDTWKENLQPLTQGLTLPDNSKEEFIKNVKIYKGNNPVTAYECDLFDTNLNDIKNIDLFFYDGPHDSNFIEKAVIYYKDCFADECICIFDDANFTDVVIGANKGLEQIDHNVIFERKILNQIEDASQWWNGIYIVVIKK